MKRSGIVLCSKAGFLNDFRQYDPKTIFSRLLNTGLVENVKFSSINQTFCISLLILVPLAMEALNYNIWLSLFPEGRQHSISTIISQLLAYFMTALKSVRCHESRINMKLLI